MSRRLVVFCCQWFDQRCISLRLVVCPAEGTFRHDAQFVLEWNSLFFPLRAYVGQGRVFVCGKRRHLREMTGRFVVRGPVVQVGVFPTRENKCYDGECWSTSWSTMRPTPNPERTLIAQPSASERNLFHGALSSGAKNTWPTLLSILA